ncbi:MAG: sensor histidine kinase [Myxococcota bacterium]
MSRAAPLLLALVSLAFGLPATWWLGTEAQAAVRQLVLEQLDGVGAAAQVTVHPPLDVATLRKLRDAAELDEVSLVTRGPARLLDASGAGEGPVDLLRLDASRLDAALAGRRQTSVDYDLGGLPFAVGYVPVTLDDGRAAVLVLEAGSRYAAAATRVSRARTIALGSTLFASLALFGLALAWSRLQRRWREAASAAAFGNALQRFAAMAAHEVRNPLATIRALLELFRERRRAVLGPDGERTVSDVLEEVERLRRLTDDLQALSSARALETRPVVLEALVAQSVARVTATATKLSVAVPEGRTEVAADPLRLGQIVDNLLRNAADARADATVTVTVRPDGDQVRVSFSDDGPGVSPRLAERLFTAFESTREQGQGLGLALSRRFAERMGATLEHRPTPRGATFVLTLRRSPGDE